MDVLGGATFICYGLPIIFLVIVILVWKSKQKTGVQNSAPPNPYVGTGTSSSEYIPDASDYRNAHYPDPEMEQYRREKAQERWDEMKQRDDAREREAYESYQQQSDEKERRNQEMREEYWEQQEEIKRRLRGEDY